MPLASGSDRRSRSPQIRNLKSEIRNPSTPRPSPLIMLSTPAADRAIAAHCFEEALDRALAAPNDCPECLLRPVLETLFRVLDFPASPRRLRRAAMAAILRIMAKLPAEKRREAKRWARAIRNAAVAIPGTPWSTVN